MKINLGCGSDILRSYVNIDSRSGTGVDIVCDITKKLPFKDHSVDEIKAFDVLEHLILADQEKVLLDLNRILKKDGILKIRTPNIEKIWEQMADDPETRNLFLYGNTSEQGIWGAHKTGHTLLSIGTMFRMMGFKIDKYQEQDTNWIFELKKEVSEIDSLAIKKILKIEKPITKNFWIYKVLRYFFEEISVPNNEVYESLFPKTGLPMTRVVVNNISYQVKRISARRLASLDLMI